MISTPALPQVRKILRYCAYYYAQCVRNYAPFRHILTLSATHKNLYPVMLYLEGIYGDHASQTRAPQANARHRHPIVYGGGTVTVSHFLKPAPPLSFRVKHSKTSAKIQNCL